MRHMLFNSVQREGPGLFVFDTCTQFIRTVPGVLRDQTDMDDVDTDGPALQGGAFFIAVSRWCGSIVDRESFLSDLNAVSPSGFAPDHTICTVPAPGLQHYPGADAVKEPHL